MADRCYHATTLLLPDGRVFSAGGGEFQVKDAQGNDVPNDLQDSHADAQLFSPPAPTSRCRCRRRSRWTG